MSARSRARRDAAEATRVEWELRLYIAGETAKCIAAFANLRAHLRGASRGPLSHRGHRPPEEPAARARRPDPRDPDARAEASVADEEDHR